MVGRGQRLMKAAVNARAPSRVAAAAAAFLGLSFGIFLSFPSAAQDDGVWVLYLPPPGTGSGAVPPRDQFVEFGRYPSFQACADQEYAGHFGYWDSDRDLSMRFLSAYCYNPVTGQSDATYE